MIKLGAVLFVILVGASYVVPANWDNFTSYGWTGSSFFGHQIAGGTNSKGDPAGVLTGAAIIFFANTGFAGVTTQVEEAKNPSGTCPSGSSVRYSSAPS